MSGWLMAWACGWWVWTVWSCAEHWQGNPNYSYGWAVPLLVIGFATRRAWLATAGARRDEIKAGGAGKIYAALTLTSALVLPLEWARQEEWHPEIVLWTICAVAVSCSLLVVWWSGGRALFRAEIFPHLFFFTAVPWPPRIEQPLTSSLMRWVANCTAELLHWSGVEAQTSGAAIALRSGLVGITEACSGIRSLQAGLMFGLAMGEWFLLRPARRVALLGIAFALALLTNLVRTATLCFQAEWHGIKSIERVHDLVGNIMITALVVGIWAAGKMLSSARVRERAGGADDFVRWLQESFRRMRGGIVLSQIRPHPGFAALVIFAAVALVSARGLHAVAERNAHTQQQPFFQVRAGAGTGNALVPVPPTIWAELSPTTGEYIRRESPDFSGGAADSYHFFWKPSPWNRFALVHRPDICMPGIGWVQNGAPEPVDVVLDGGSVRCYAFRFHRENAEALQLWGIWRNGVAVPLDYTAAQALGAAQPPAALRLDAKRGSATEIISCSVIQAGGTPQLEAAKNLLKSVFIYQRSSPP